MDDLPPPCPGCGSPLQPFIHAASREPETVYECPIARQEMEPWYKHQMRFREGARHTKQQHMQ